MGCVMYTELIIGKEKRSVCSNKYFGHLISVQ